MPFRIRTFLRERRSHAQPTPAFQEPIRDELIERDSSVATTISNTSFDDEFSFLTLPEKESNNDFVLVFEANELIEDAQELQSRSIDEERDLPPMQILDLDDDNDENNERKRNVSINCGQGYQPNTPLYKSSQQAVLSETTVIASSEENKEENCPGPKLDVRSGVDAALERPPIGLYLYGDEEHLTAYECLVRKQVEFFEPLSPAEGAPSARMVGLRCRHCAHQSSKDSIALNLHRDRLAHAADKLTQGHMLRSCPFVPSSLRDELARLRDSRTAFRSVYWCETARECGIVAMTNTQTLRWVTPYEPNPFGRRKLHRQYYNYRLDSRMGSTNGRCGNLSRPFPPI